MVFNTYDRIYQTGEFDFILDDQPIELVKEYTYLGAVFRGLVFMMSHVARDRLCRGYASLAHLERQ